MRSAKQFVRIGIVYLVEAVLFVSPKRLISFKFDAQISCVKHFHTMLKTILHGVYKISGK